MTALELYDHKLALIEENAQRLGLADKVKTQKLDASQVHQVFPADSFDKILVDAPCSGIGLIRHMSTRQIRGHMDSPITSRAC